VKEELNGCRVAAVFVLINVVRERETRGGKERKIKGREAVRAGKTVAGTRRSYSSSVEHEAVRQVSPGTSTGYVSSLTLGFAYVSCPNFTF
jgi:hypothetical protein